VSKFSIIIPVYYNENSLGPLYNELCRLEAKLKELGVDLELIFVDDGSGDNSLQELLKIKESRPETIVVKLTRNFGAVHAVKTGLNYVTGDAFSYLAADLQDPPDLIPEMVQRWINGARYVICVRKSRHDPWLSRFFSTIYYRVLRAWIIPNFPQGGYDLGLMDRAMLPYVMQSGKYFNPPMYTYWLGYKPEVIYYTRQAREHGKSRWTFGKRLTLFLDSILSFSFVPIRTITLIGFLVSMASFLYGIVIIISYFLGLVPKDAPGWASLAALLSFLLGLVLVMLGIIGEYVWRIFEEVNKRPEAVVEQVYRDSVQSQIKSAINGRSEQDSDGLEQALS
jgi:glycosyltransferase involved in cell wall biosynthesis